MTNMMKYGCAVLVLVLCSASLPKGISPPSWQTGFEAADGFQLTTASPWTHSLGGRTLEASNWEIHGGTASVPWMAGGQGLRAGATGAALVIKPVSNPRHVTFQLAVDAHTTTPTWNYVELEMQTAPLGVLGQPILPWTTQAVFNNDFTAREDLTSTLFMNVFNRMEVSMVLNGQHAIRFEVTVNAQARKVMLDEVQIYEVGTTPDHHPFDALTDAAPLLAASPPETPLDRASLYKRHWVLRKLDHEAAVYQTGAYAADPTVSTNFTSFAQSQFTIMIAQLTTAVPGPNEVFVYHFYSSGYVIVTPGETIAIDLQEGPATRTTHAYQQGIAMGFTAQHVADLAPHIDYLLYTHTHQDHLSFAFLDAVVQAGGTVVGPNDLNNHPDSIDLLEKYAQLGPPNFPLFWSVAATVDPWNPGDNDLTTNPAPYEPDGPGGLQIRVHADRQATFPAQPNCSLPPSQPPHAYDPTCYAYHIVTSNGVSLIHYGDTNHTLLPSGCTDQEQAAAALAEGVYDWTRELKTALGLTIDLKISSGPLLHAGTVNAMIYAEHGPMIRTEGHEWEMFHTPHNLNTWMWRGPSTSPDPRLWVQRFPMALGERYVYKKFSTAPTATDNGDGTVTVSFSTALPVSATITPTGAWTAAAQTDTDGHDHSFTLSAPPPCAGNHGYYITSRKASDPSGVDLGPCLGSPSSPLSLNLAQGLVLSVSAPNSGSLDVINCGGTAGNFAFTALTTIPGTFPNGFWFGLDIPVQTLVMEYLLAPPSLPPYPLVGGNPFLSTFDAAGNTHVYFPGGIPPGIDLYGVSIELSTQATILQSSAPVHTLTF